jgi:ATP-binding cassette subfamily B protein/subfamily B ATP-binding cassette protein MsbA
LVPRFHDPQTGRVLLNGIDVRRFTLRSLRDQISLVLQEPVLFTGTIRDNIAYGGVGVSDVEVLRAAKAANAHEFVKRLPDGYGTVLGERGGTLSGGQRQRISIARAIVRNAPILLLDEPTSGLDAESEALVMDALQRLMQGRTTFVIAHRLSTIEHADLIVVLEQGQIRETGTHRELLRAGGLYARLHALQFTDASAGAQVPLGSYRGEVVHPQSPPGSQPSIPRR